MFLPLQWKSKTPPCRKVRGKEGAPLCVLAEQGLGYRRCSASARLNVSTTVCASRSTTATSPSSKAQG